MGKRYPHQGPVQSICSEYSTDFSIVNMHVRIQHVFTSQWGADMPETTHAYAPAGYVALWRTRAWW